MTPSRPKRSWLAAMIGPCIFGLLMAPAGQGLAVASPAGDGTRAQAPSAINLRLSSRGATRVLADLTGAAQEEDKEKPRSMEEQAAPPTTPPPASAAAAKKEQPPADSMAFLKDWPFWVIVGGVIVAGVGGYMLLRNSNQEGPCAPQFTGGCF